MNILGISCYYHDAAAALIKDGEIVAAAQEERFTRKKHDPNFPANAIRYCLREGGIDPGDIDIIAFYDKPFIKFERIIETHLSFAPRGLRLFLMAMPVWLRQKLWIDDDIRKEVPDFKGKIIFTEHHESHAASAFFPSPFEEAAVLTVDGVGEWATTTIGKGDRNSLRLLEEVRFPHSLGLLYSAFTYYLGFKVNSGEYKVMGLAPYGKPKYADLIYSNLIHVRDDGSFSLNMEYFEFPVGLHMVNERFGQIFGVPRRKPETLLEQVHMDIAASLQKVTEEIMLKLARHAKAITGSRNLCLAGGVALNCVANGELWRSGEFENIWIQPAAGDAGGALGAALVGWHIFLNKPRKVNVNDSQKGSLLGPSFSTHEIETWLKSKEIPFVKLDRAKIYSNIAGLLAEGNVIGFFSGRMEFGPRALGARSIIADPRDTDMQTKLNLKIKFRESFRPFAPAVLAEKVSEWFDFEGESPYMLMTCAVIKDKRLDVKDPGDKWGIEWLKVPKSIIPAVTHVDFSARIQTVDEKRNSAFYKLLHAFDDLTHCPVLVNTSFNVRGEPIVNSPEDAYRCFMRTEMDYLVLENFVISKKDQPPAPKDSLWQKEYELD